jgi:hypothetical protein
VAQIQLLEASYSFTAGTITLVWNELDSQGNLLDSQNSSPRPPSRVGVAVSLSATRACRTERSIQTTTSTPILLSIGGTNYFGIGTGAFGSGHGEAFFGNSSTPSGNPSGGYYVYASSGALKGVGSSGTTTTIGAADLEGFIDTKGHGHCPECGTDFAHEWHNDEYGSLTVCMACLTEEIGDRPWIVRKHKKAA